MASNQLLSLGHITNKALSVLENNLVFTKSVNREYDDTFAQRGAKIGDTANIRKPPRYMGRRTATIAPEGSVETSVPLTLNTQYGVDLSFTSKDMTLDIDDFSERFLKPAMSQLANNIDQDGLALYKQIYNTVGTPGTVPSSLTPFLQAKARLAQEGAPIDADITALLEPVAEVTVVDGLRSLFQSSEQIKKQYEAGVMGTAAGMTFKMSQNVYQHTTGTQGGTPLVNGASQTGSSLVTDGWTAAAAQRLNVGDVFTIAGVYAINPQTRQSTGALRQFVVTAAGISDGSGNMTISISPSIVGPISSSLGAYNQTVSALPADNAAITVLGSSAQLAMQNMVFHKNAFAFACADLEDVPGDCVRKSDKRLGLSLRMVKFYDGTNDRVLHRLDLLGGWAVIRNELAVRVAG